MRHVIKQQLKWDKNTNCYIETTLWVNKKGQIIRQEERQLSFEIGRLLYEDNY